MENCDTQLIPIFNLEVPTLLKDVSNEILDPRKTYQNEQDWTTKATDLASKFIENFVQYSHNNECKNLIKAGPQL